MEKLELLKENDLQMQGDGNYDPGCRDWCFYDCYKEYRDENYDLTHMCTAEDSTQY